MTLRHKCYSLMTGTNKTIQNSLWHHQGCYEFFLIDTGEFFRFLLKYFRYIMFFYVSNFLLYDLWFVVFIVYYTLWNAYIFSFYVKMYEITHEILIDSSDFSTSWLRQECYLAYTKLQYFHLEGQIKDK